MLEKWIVSIVISFVLRQVAKFKESTDWVKVRADLETRVKDLVPGSWFDSEAVLIVDLILCKIEEALGAADVLQDLLEKVAAQDWAGAALLLKEILLKVLPTDCTAYKAVAAL